MNGSRKIHWLKLLVPGIVFSVSLNAQQAVPAGNANSGGAPAAAPTTKDEIEQLKAQLIEQQHQLDALRAAMQRQENVIEEAEKQAQRTNAPASLGEVASLSPVLPVAPLHDAANAIGLGQSGQAPEKNESPLGFRIGGATFTPSGFADFISVTRSSNVGSGIGTSFGGVPFENTANGNLSETHFSMQNSRIGLRVDSMWHDYKILGYVETDFLGNAPSNPFVTSNADTLRMRLYFMDIQKDAFELTAGQTWSLMTPNRKGIGVMPSDVYYTQDIDTNYQAGLSWARQTGVRLTWKPSDNVHWAFAVENPEQYAGAAVVFPSKLATVGAELDNNSGGTAIPNLFPDFISKLAFDGGLPGHNAHLEIVGLLTGVRTYNSLTSGPGALQRSTAVGGGGEVNFNFELGKGFRILASSYLSDGGGRYIGTGLGPDAILRADGSPSLVRSGSGTAGFEYQASRKFLLYGYYGGVFIGKDLAIDQDGKTVIGYGVTNSTSANRAIQEATFGMQHNFWKSPEYGALMLAFQYSYLTRNPWNITTSGSPTNASTNIGYVDLRYTLP